MGELAVMLKGAFSFFREMLAHLGFVLLFHDAILLGEVVVVVLLLSHLFHNLTRRVIEVSDSTVGINSFSLVLRL